jgi:hypothetical protein
VTDAGWAAAVAVGLREAADVWEVVGSAEAGGAVRVGDEEGFAFFFALVFFDGDADG